MPGCLKYWNESLQFFYCQTDVAVKWQQNVLQEELTKEGKTTSCYTALT